MSRVNACAIVAQALCVVAWNSSNSKGTLGQKSGFLERYLYHRGPGD